MPSKKKPMHTSPWTELYLSAMRQQDDQAAQQMLKDALSQGVSILAAYTDMLLPTIDQILYNEHTDSPRGLQAQRVYEILLEHSYQLRFKAKHAPRPKHRALIIPSARYYPWMIGHLLAETLRQDSWEATAIWSPFSSNKLPSSSSENSIDLLIVIASWDPLASNRIPVALNKLVATNRCIIRSRNNVVREEIATWPVCPSFSYIADYARESIGREKQSGI